MNWAFIENAITGATGHRFTLARADPAFGGCINQCFVLTSGMGKQYFVKVNAPATAPGFQQEWEALSAIAATGTVRVPRAVAQGANTQHAFLVLEFLPLQPLEEPSFEELGRQLAALHRHTSGAFGWPQDNLIGSSPQFNGWLPEWPDFFRTRRLEPQLAWAANQGLSLQQAPELLQCLEQLLDHHPAASLVHGDLWAGNAAAVSDREPVLMDPASYYGDREVDLAFSVMFGGFSDAFYGAYEEAFPLPDGAHIRMRLYNLYHELNHFNLFGGGYGEQARQTIDWLLSEVRN